MDSKQELQKILEAYNLSSAAKNKANSLIKEIENNSKMELINELDKVFSGKHKPELLK